ncbi:MAG: NAD-dependent epimerase/dehydratase family protein [Nitriliruptoraceae bacterium]
MTGAAGFIGRAITDRLRARGVEARGVDVIGDPATGIVAGDVTDTAGWSHHLDGVDTVVHTAAIVSNVVPMARMHAVNVVGTRAVLAAATAAGVRRVVHLSSVVVHGYDLPAWVDEDHPVTLTGDAYVDTKIAGEQVVLAAHARGDVEVVVVRPGDVYGPGSRPWVVLPLTYLKAGQAVLPARGRGICSHVHVDNLVDGVLRAVAVPGAAGHVLHVTDGVATTWADYLTELGRLVGRRPRRLPTPVAVALASAVGRAERARGRPSELCAASMRLLARTGSYRIDRARDVLGYTPTVDLETGLAGVARWAAEVGLADGPAPRTVPQNARSR